MIWKPSLLNRNYSLQICILPCAEQVFFFIIQDMVLRRTIRNDSQIWKTLSPWKPSLTGPLSLLLLGSCCTLSSHPASFSRHSVLVYRVTGALQNTRVTTSISDTSKNAWNTCQNKEQAKAVEEDGSSAIQEKIQNS